MFAQGLEANEIAQRLSVTIETTRSHLRRAYLKFRNRGVNVASSELMRNALRADGVLTD
jgi:DNA-binding CsgD family transcriptional regulator